MIYCDNAATTKLDEEALSAMLPFFKEEYANASQPYCFAKKSRDALNSSRTLIAKCIGSKSNEVYFTSGGSESDNWAIKLFDDSFGLEKHIIISAIEHHAIINSCNHLESTRDDIKLHYLPVNKEGEVLPSDLASVLASIGEGDNKKVLVSVMLSNNEIGTIQPIKELAKIAHEYNALFHTDAVQSMGHISIDVNDLGVDMMSASAHKFNGPKGVGFLFVREGIDLKPLIDGGSQEDMHRAGTENVASIVGMSVALKNNCNSICENTEHLKRLEAILIEKLQESGLDFVRNGSKNTVPGNVSLSFYGASGEMILHRLDLMGICVSTGSACDGKNDQISHVIKAIDLDEDYALGTIRISLGKNNTEEDVLLIASAINKIIGGNCITTNGDKIIAVE